MNILLAGGAGYIGSHTSVVREESGHEVVLFDNFCNSKKSVLDLLEKILGKALPCVEGEIRDTTLVAKKLKEYKIDGVIHSAGLKSVSESVEKPIEYYANNAQGTISILEAMKSTNIKTLIFSSRATVYSDPQYLSINEQHPANPINPYGKSKLQAEEILRDLVTSDPGWRITSLSYFNPVGAHGSGLFGVDPNGTPNNLMSYVAKVASGELPFLNFFGDDYEIKDGTGKRDHIHVMDIASGYIASLESLKNQNALEIVNLGTGKSHSVLDLALAFEKVSDRIIKRVITQSRS